MNDLIDSANQERLVGFDARTVEVPNWLAKRREQYLLRPEVLQPLSADDMVWPSVFLHPVIPGEPEYVGLPRPEWIGRNTPLWENFEYLATCLDDNWGVNWQPCRLIAISVLYDHCSHDERAELDQWVVATQPFKPLNAWEFLGYDICDGSVLSGLMNCGYMPDHEDVQALRNRYAPLLNQHHLFDEVRHASDFRLMSNKRVIEHSPFFVYGLYSIPSHGLT